MGALFGAVGACMRAWLDIKTGRRIKSWLLASDVVLSATLGIVAFGVSRELAYLWYGHAIEEVWWICAASSGMAGSVGPYVVRYVTSTIQKKLGINPEDLKGDKQ